MMTPFQKIESTGLVLAQSNIDTDVIYPARYLKAVTKTGLGKHLFADWAEMHVAAGRLKSCPQVLIAGANFGCGSSREHAVWALTDYGVRCVIAPSFGDIFAGNSGKNGLLLVRLPESEIARLSGELKRDPTLRIEVDLVECRIAFSNGIAIDFAIDAGLRESLLNGEDEIAKTLKCLPEIERFEERRRARFQ